MLHGKTVGVVVPCYNEASQIAGVLEAMPDFVDTVIVVDDASTDDTADVVSRWIENHAANVAAEFVLLRHDENRGCGASIATGYKESVRCGIDVTASMDGDGQMPADQLSILVSAVASGHADYAKGNRLFHGEAWDTIPKHRYLGNAFLSMLTKIASGYWHVADSQSGYRAISLKALRLLDLDHLYPRYGYPNDLLVRLNALEMRVADIHVRPIYNVGEHSKMKVLGVMPRMSWLIFKRFVWRMWWKYVVFDFHPLVLFYGFGVGALGLGLGFGAFLVIDRLLSGPQSATSALFSALLLLSGLQLILFAMSFDMQINRHLRAEPPPDAGLPQLPAASRSNRQKLARVRHRDAPPVVASPYRPSAEVSTVPGDASDAT